MRRPYVSNVYFIIIVNLIVEILLIFLMCNYGEKREMRSFTFLDSHLVHPVFFVARNSQIDILKYAI
jgi:hypothetical protein